jgi:hypothetical protein
MMKKRNKIMKINYSPFEWVLWVLIIGSIVIIFTVNEDNIILHKIANFIVALVIIYSFIKGRKNNK